MRHIVYTLLIFIGAIALAGCQNSSVPANTSESDAFEIQGTVVYKDIEGGFFAIDSDNGKKYNPVSLPEAYRKDGLKVIIKARPSNDAMSIHMYGAIIEVVEIEAK